LGIGGRKEIQGGGKVYGNFWGSAYQGAENKLLDKEGKRSRGVRGRIQGGDKKGKPEKNLVIGGSPHHPGQRGGIFFSFLSWKRKGGR